MEKLIETIIGFLFISGFFYIVYKAIKKVVSGEFKKEIKEQYKEKVDEEDMRLAKDYLKGLKEEHFDSVVNNINKTIKEALKDDKTEKSKPKNIKRRRK